MTVTRVDHALQTLLRYEWLLLALLLPAALFPTPARLPALLLILLPWLARRRVTGSFLPATPLDVSLLALLAMVLVSLYATFDLAFSLPKIAGIVYGAAVYYAAAAGSGRSPRHLWQAVALFLIASLGVAALGLAGLPAVAGSLVAPLLPGAVAGVNPNEVAGVLLWVTPLALVLAGTAVQPGRPLPLLPQGRPATAVRFLLPALALFFVAAVLLTRSRGGLLGLAAGVVFILIVAAGPRLRRRLLAPGLLLGLLALAVAGSIGRQALADFLATPDAAGNDPLTSLAGRQELWTRALYAIQDFPFTGMGMNTFRRVVHVLYPLFIIPPDTDVAHAHNHLLQTAVDLGLPGLVAYGALWIGAGVMLWRAWQGAPTPWRRALSLGLAASLLAYFVYGMLDAVALGARPGFIFWFLLGLAAGVYRVTVRKTPTVSRKLRSFRETAHA